MLPHPVIIDPVKSHLVHNGGNISYQVTGQGEPVVFVHGFTLDHRMWQPQVEAFDGDYKVVTYDVRGYGQSSPPTQPYSHSDDLKALLEHLNIPSAHIIGLSMGGRIAINFALQNPDAVSSLTVISSSLDGYNDNLNRDWGATEYGLDHAKKKWLNSELFAATRRHAGATAMLRKIVADYPGWHWLNTDVFRSPSTNARSRLGEISVPTLVVTGEQDLPDFQNIANIVASAVNGSQKVVVPNAGHMVNLEASAQVNLILADFLRKNSQAT